MSHQGASYQSQPCKMLWYVLMVIALLSIAHQWDLTPCWLKTPALIGILSAAAVGWYAYQLSMPAKAPILTVNVVGSDCQ